MSASSSSQPQPLRLLGIHFESRTAKSIAPSSLSLTRLLPRTEHGERPQQQRQTPSASRRACPRALAVQGLKQRARTSSAPLVLRHVHAQPAQRVPAMLPPGRCSYWSPRSLAVLLVVRPGRPRRAQAPHGARLLPARQDRPSRGRVEAFRCLGQSSPASFRRVPRTKSSAKPQPKRSPILNSWGSEIGSREATETIPWGGEELVGAGGATRGVDGAIVATRPATDDACRPIAPSRSGGSAWRQGGQ